MCVCVFKVTENVICRMCEDAVHQDDAKNFVLRRDAERVARCCVRRVEELGKHNKRRGGGRRAAYKVLT